MSWFAEGINSWFISSSNGHDWFSTSDIEPEQIVPDQPANNIGWFYRTPNQMANDGQQDVIPGVTILTLEAISGIDNRGIATIINTNVNFGQDRYITQNDISFASQSGPVTRKIS